MNNLVRFLLIVLLLGPVLAGCNKFSIDDLGLRAERPIPAELTKKMKTKGMAASAPIMVRIYKQENQLEVWKAAANGRFDLLETYEICKWSGKLGPKIKEGDRQAPEGFYMVSPGQMNPNSDYHLAFNMGFPNAFDRAHERTGTHLMVHGACSSAGCYSMTDERISEIYALARESFKGGQKAFQIQAFPFRMTPKNMAAYKSDPNFDFWSMLKEGADHFEITRVPPKVDVCDKRYVFNRVTDDEKAFKAAKACPESTIPDSLALAYSEKQSKDEKAFAEELKRKAFADLLAGRKQEDAAQAEATEAASIDATPAADAEAGAAVLESDGKAAAVKPIEDVAKAKSTDSSAEATAEAKPADGEAEPATVVAAEPAKKKTFSLLSIFRGGN